MASAVALLDLLAPYREVRRALLAELGLAPSNRDPLAEWSEHFVAALMRGTLASSRVQASYDLTLDSGDTVQVRYLANPSERWINEHEVRSHPDATWYAIALFEAFQPVGVVAFPRDLSTIGSALGKRHPRQTDTLQFTAANWRAIRDHSVRFTSLGVRIWLPGRDHL